MLVIADQAAAGIGGERRLAGAGKSEEQRGHAIGADVGRAVHGKHVALGQQEVHHAEDGLLHFAGIFRAADEHQLLAEVDQHEDFGVGAVALGIGLEAGRADDGELGLVGLQLFRGRANKQLPHKKVVPGVFVDHLDGQRVLRIGAAKQVLDKKLFALQIVEHALIKRVELIGREGLVGGAPRDFVFGDGVLDGELVFGRTAGALAGLGHQRAARRQFGLTAAKRGFHQRSGKQIAVYLLLSEQLRYFGSLQNGGHKRAPKAEAK